LKTIEAVCATSTSVKRERITFDEHTGLIVEIGEPIGKSDYTYDDDHLLFAGMGDIHIHAREDVSGKNCYKEDFLSARAAMYNGGLAHAGDMPNNPIPPIDDQSYEAKFKLAAKAHGDIWLYAGIGPGTRPLSYPVPYKVYMGPSVGELYFKDFETLDKTLENYRGLAVSFHCEDPELLEEHKDELLHHLRRPVGAEVVATADALKLIEKHGLKGKLCHYSSQQGLALIREATGRGVEVSLEVTPQHLYFDIDHLNEVERQMFQMNPPIRFETDRKAMMAALLNGDIQFLATDHAPHTMEEKQQGTSGLTGLDTFGPFVTWLIDKGLDPKLVAKIAAENPGDFHNQFLPSWARICSSFKVMGKGVGFLKPSYRANFTVLNLKKPLKISADNLKTKVGHSPFLGTTFPGSVAALFIGGQKV
jgi:dihydroorotase